MIKILINLIKDSCPLYGVVKDIIDVCTDDFNSQSQQTDAFGFGWTRFNQSYTPPNGYESIYHAFQFKDAITLQGSTIQGKFGTYDGSGYLYELRGKLSYLQGNLSLLQKMNWIDRQTRAVFAEFSVYNPNINLIMVSTILIEFLPAGSIITSARFDTLNLFSDLGGLTSFKNVCLFVFMAFIVYYMFAQLRLLVNESLSEYFANFWTFIEWAIIVSAWVSFFMFILRLSKANEVLDFFSQTQGYSYIKLQTVNEYNQVLTYSLGLCTTFVYIKFLKMLRFNKNISYLGLTLKRCYGELVSYTLIFFIVWFAFVQVMYLVYGDNLRSYSSLKASMATAFQVMLGKFDVNQMNSAHATLGPLIFSAYNVVIIFFALNIFISIILEAFEKVRVDGKSKADKFDIFEHVWGKMKLKFGKKSKEIECKDIWKRFSLQVDHLNKIIVRVGINFDL